VIVTVEGDRSFARARKFLNIVVILEIGGFLKREMRDISPVSRI